MNKFKYFTLLISFLLTSQLWAAAWDQTMPLQTPAQQAEAFLKIRALIPSLSTGAARYSFDPVRLFGNQTQIESLMAENPVYADLKNSRQDLVSFTIFAETKGSGDASAKASNWNAWVLNATATAQQASVSNQESAVKKIQELLVSPWLGKSQGIVVGLAQLLPNELKKDFFALPLAAKVEVLEKNLPSEIVSHGFAPARLGWGDSELSKTEIINRLKMSVQTEHVFTALVVYHYSLLQAELASPKEYLAKWKLEGNAKKTLEQIFNSQVSKLIPTEEKSAQVSLVMREVPPVVGIFRGFAGNDCATYSSFPFPNAPNEYTFFVYDAKGGMKGYAQGAKVLVNGQAAFYLHTIVGPRMTREDAFSIMRTLNQEKSHMGWSEILLPSLEKLGQLVNSVAVQNAMKEVISATLVPMEYQDAEIRSTLKSKFNISKTYDDAAENKAGHRMDLAKLGPAIQVQTGLASGLDKVDSRIDKNELIGMLLQLGKNRQTNDPIIKALSAHAGLSEGSVMLLIRKTNNNSHYPVKNFIADISANLKEEGFDFKEDHFQKNLSLVAFGLLKSPDLIKDKSLLEATLATLYAQRETNSVQEFLINNEALFGLKNISDPFFKALYNDVHEAEFTEPKALRVALSVNPRVIFNSPEILAMIMATTRGSNALRDFVMQKPSFANELKKTEGGRLLLARVRVYRQKMDFLLPELLRTESVTAYLAVLDNKVNELFGSPAIAEKNRLKRHLMAASLDHFLSLKPPADKLSVSRDLFVEPGYERELRKIIPALMTVSEVHIVQHNLTKLGALTESTKQGLVRTISYGLSQRSDIATLDAKDVSNLKFYFPAVDLETLRGNTCESLF